METIRQWIAGVCCAAVGCTALELLYPDGTMQKPARYVMMLFFLAALILPLSNIQPTWNEDITHTESQMQQVGDEVEKLIHQQTIEIAQTQLSGTIREIAKGIGVIPKDISVSINTDETGAWRLERVQVKLTASQRLYEHTLTQRMEMQLNVTPEFIYVS